LLGLLLILGLVLAIRQWAWAPVVVIGGSMQPTLCSGQITVLSKLSYHFRPPRRGDIVLVDTGRELYAKRIIGLPGEDLALKAGVLYVNGRRLAEPYVQFPGDDSVAAGRLGTNRFLIAGDNRPDSTVAVVNRERIVGVLICWPNTVRPPATNYDAADYELPPRQ
jgi:signal peptidase I